MQADLHEDFAAKDHTHRNMDEESISRRKSAIYKYRSLLKSQLPERIFINGS